jgi:hypothetical protein
MSGVNPNNVAQRFGGQQTLFWRVGGRNENDPIQPDGGWVFTLPGQFITQ